MTEKAAQAKQYQHRNNSNLVLQAETRTARIGSEPTGEPETLRGKNLYSFGDRAVQTKPTETKKRVEEKAAKKPRKKSKKEALVDIKAEGTVLSANIESGSQYRPKTTETRAVYELLLNDVQKILGDQPQDVLRGATDEVVVCLKTSTATRDVDRKGELEFLLGPLSDEQFTTFIRLGRGIVDFYEDEGKGDREGEDEIALVFEDSDNSDVDEVQGSDSEDESEGEETVSSTSLAAHMDDDEEMDDSQAYTLDVVQVDAFWLQRELGKFYNDPLQAQAMADKVLAILQSQTDERLCESALVQLLDYDKFEFVKTLLTNKHLIIYCTLLGRAQTEEEKEQIKTKMRQDPTLAPVLAQIEGGGSEGGKGQAFEREIRAEARRLAKQYRQSDSRGPGESDSSLKVVDLDSLSFMQGSHFMSNRQCTLPEGSFRTQKRGYEEFHIPPAKTAQLMKNERRRPVSELPSWAQPAFYPMKELNNLQSKVFHAAFETHENLLICAPTGAGKTNVALLTMLHEIGLHLTGETEVALDDFKMVYVAPMKSLVQEMVFNFGKRLQRFGINVRELSGDQNLTKQQIHDTQLIITTPEKWDIVTRKSGDRTYTQLVRLVIFDEIHLLHDERGPVLESIIARTIRQVERTQEMVRLVGLSATLPNHEDVGSLLRADPKDGVFHFDNSYRPVPLEQTYVGVMEKSSFKRFQLMNEVTYQKVIERAGKSQILIFVHSRKETGKTARTIRDMALANETLGRFLREDSASREILQSEADDHVKDLELKDLLPYGFAIHHAGMQRTDRSLVEDLFRDQHVQVLVSTATLAWGVNLPAHTVIIKGTQVYSPEKGRWVELSPLDVLQMMGRAGRPQFDTSGEGIMITTHSELQYYLSLLNQQLPIESQFVAKMVDNLNAEIVLGTVQNVSEAVTWLSYTYLYICMLRSPNVYGVSDEDFEDDPEFINRRKTLIHTAATLLDRAHLINYDRKSGNFQVTDLGRVASHYYITYNTIMTYNDHLKQYMTDIEIFRLFSLSSEFANLIVRQEEKQELEKMIERVPIPVKESMEDPTAKVNVLLQVYISKLKLDGFALIADMVYVTQSASRLMRALFEIVIKRGWARLADRTLSLCKMVDRRMWSSQNPLRQFRGIPEAIIRKLERKEFSLDRLYDLNSQQIGELIQFPAQGKALYRFIHQFPRIDLSALVQPITRSMLRVELTLTPDFNWSDEHHGVAESFWIIVEDVDGEVILHHEFFILKKKYCEAPHYVNFTVPLFEPLAPQYFIKVVSDRWLGAETVLPISFRHMLLPERYSPPTDLLDLQPLPVKALQHAKFEAMYSEFEFFNPIQTQVFHTLYSTEENALICAPTGSGKTIMAEFAILRLLKTAAEEGMTRVRCVYVVSHDSLCKERFVDWRQRFSTYLGYQVVLLTGETGVDLKLLDVGNIIISNPKNWDRLSRRWKQRKAVQNVNLFIADELHLLGGNDGHILEAVISRMRYISSQLENKIRIVALSTSLANARDVGEWIGATSHSLFNFRPHVRPVPLEIHIQGFDQVFAESRHLAMYRPTLLAIERHAKSKPVLLFVNSRKEAFRLGGEIRFTCQGLSDPRQYRHCSEEDLDPFLEQVESKFLRELLSFGIGVLHSHMNAKDRDIVNQLYTSDAIQVLVAERTECWGISFNAHLVVIMGTQYYDGKEHRYVDYPVTDILQMMGKASRPKVDMSGVCVIYCYAPKKQFYLKFLHEPLPIESHFDHFLADHFNAEIVTRTVENKQDAVDYLTWTLLYRCLTQNPNYYNLQGVSHRHLSDHLSELVEHTLNDLDQSSCITIENEMDLSPLNLGMIAAYYYINYTTIELFASSLTSKTKMKGLIEILSTASEFSELPIRRKEAGILSRLAKHVPVKIDKPDFTSTHTKANILFQCHFSRRQLPPLLQADQKFVVETAVKLLQAMVDVISSNRWLGPALASMELSQMVTQAVWDKDSHLKQLPHFNDSLLRRCKEAKVDSIFDLMDMEDADRKDLLSVLGPRELSDVARMCNDYPNIELVYEILDPEDLSANADIDMKVVLEREMDEDQAAVPPVHAPFFPISKTEGWWLVVCDVKRKELLAIKRITLQRKSAVKLSFQAPEGEHNLTLYFMCDSYAGCDQEYEFEVKVGKAMSESEEEEDNDDDPMSE